jgi:trigger factor
MQVSIEDLSSVKKIMHIEVPHDDVARKLNEAYKDLNKNVKIKGFRQGKTPRSVLERHYKKDVNEDITQKLIQESLTEAIQKTGINPVGMPLLDTPELDEKVAYKYTATVEIAPEIEDFDFKGLQLTKTLYKSSEEEVEAQLKMLQKKVSDKELVTEDRSIKESDFGVIDYTVYKGDQPLAEATPMENYNLKVGEGTIHRDFDEQIVGMKAGENKKITITFPSDPKSETEPEKSLDFDVTLKEIREEKFHEINDDFAKKFGTYENLDALKDHIRKTLKEGYDKHIEQDLNEQIFQKLLARGDFEVPDSMVNHELDQIIADIEKRLQAYDKTIQDMGMTPEELKVKYWETAEKQVKRHVLLNKIIQQEKLELSDEEMELGYEEMAKAHNQPVQVFKKFYETNLDHLNFFKHALLEKKAINLIIDNSIITEKEPEPETDTETEES